MRFLLVFFCIVFQAMANIESAYSSNIHAIVKVDTRTDNVIVAVPWTFYTPNMSSTNILPVVKLVRPTNLDEGDLLLCVNDENEYESWMLVDNDGIKSWEPVITFFTKNTSRRQMTISDYSQTIARGLGLWVIRRNPFDNNGEYKPIYLYGQYCKEKKYLSIAGGELGTNAIMIANPNCLEETDVNEDIEFENVYDKDTLSIPNGTDAWNLCLWDRSLNKWYYSSATRVGRKVVTSKNYNLKIPAGHGFWYIRRAHDIVNLMFKK